MAIAYIPDLKHFFVLEKFAKKNENEKKNLKGQIKKRKKRRKGNKKRNMGLEIQFFLSVPFLFLTNL